MFVRVYTVAEHGKDDFPPSLIPAAVQYTPPNGNDFPRNKKKILRKKNKIIKRLKIITT